MRRPFVTLIYAQSLDGSLAAAPGQPLALSGPEAMTFTHQLRAAHDAILVGIGDRKSTRLNSSHIQKSRMPSSA